MAETDAEAARKRAERRARIKAQISELEAEVSQWESCKQELVSAKSDLAAAEAEINKGMQVTENVNTNLSSEYPGYRYNNLIALHIESILSNKASIQSNINAYRNELDIAIKDCDDAISYRESRIRYYKNQL